MGLSAGGAYQLGSGLTTLGAGMFGRQQQSTSVYDALSGPFQAMQAMQQSSADEQDALYARQAQVAMEEADAEAEAKARSAQNVMKEQANQYNASGVLLEGSPLEVLNETRRLAEQEISAISRRGAAQAELYRRQGAVARNKSRSDLFRSSLGFEAARLTDRIQGSKEGNYDTALRQLGSVLGNVNWKGGAKSAIGKMTGLMKSRQPAAPKPIIHSTTPMPRSYT